MPLLTEAFRAYSGWRQSRLRRMNPVEAQRSTLMRLLRHAESTGFGRAHNFSQIQSVSDFQARVPLRRYEDFWNEFWSGPFPVLKDISWPGTIPFFALTSGTTSGRSKYIPVSKEMVRSNRRAALRVLMSHVLRRPDSRILENKLFFLGGAINLSNEAAGIQSGDLSGISIATSPWWLQRLSYPPPEIAGISDWEERMDAVLDDPRSRNISGIAGQTAWLLAFLEKAMQSSRGDRHTLAERFPLLELVLVGGVNFAPYDRRLAEIIGAGAVSLREIYAASEGFIGSGNGAPGSGVTPLLDNGLFFEFVPLDEIGSARPARHWMATVQPDIDYAIVVSSNAGLWAYQIGDIVRFEEVKTPNILVKGRTEQTLSAFGEHLIEAEITEAVFTAANKIKRRVQEYAVAPIFPHGYSEPGYHLYVVEFDGLNIEECIRRKFIKEVDLELGRLNQDYSDIMAGGLLIRQPELMSAPPGTFHSWMKRRGKLGGQNKIPRIFSDSETFRELLQFASRENLRSDDRTTK